MSGRTKASSPAQNLAVGSSHPVLKTRPAKQTYSLRSFGTRNNSEWLLIRFESRDFLCFSLPSRISHIVLVEVVPPHLRLCCLIVQIGNPPAAHPAKATMYICKRPPRPVKGLKIEHIVFKWIDLLVSLGSFSGGSASLLQLL